MRKRFNILPTYHFEENTDGQIRGAAERVLRDCTIYGNCGKNLVPYPFPYHSIYGTKNGITVTDSGNGTITVNGTATANTVIYLVSALQLSAGKYFLSGNPIENNNVTLTIGATALNGATLLFVRDEGKGTAFDISEIAKSEEYGSCTVAIRINTGATLDNLVFKPQLELGDTATDYEPYKEVGDLDAESGKYVLPVTISGKNLLNSYGYSAQSIFTPSTKRTKTNNYGTTISTTEPNTTLTVTQTKVDSPNIPSSYTNGYFCIGINSKPIGKKIKFVCDIKITNNPLNVNSFLTLPNGVNVDNGAITLENGRAVGIFYMPQNGTRQFIEIRTAGCSMIISNIMITEADETNTNYEPYTAPKTTNLLLDAPLGPGESISCREKGLLVPELATTDPNITNYITFGAEVKPSSAKFDYYKY